MRAPTPLRTRQKSAHHVFKTNDKHGGDEDEMTHTGYWKGRLRGGTTMQCSGVEIGCATQFAQDTQLVASRRGKAMAWKEHWRGQSERKGVGPVKSSAQAELTRQGGGADCWREPNPKTKITNSREVKCEKKTREDILRATRPDWVCNVRRGQVHQSHWV